MLELVIVGMIILGAAGFWLRHMRRVHHGEGGCGCGCGKCGRKRPKR